MNNDLTYSLNKRNMFIEMVAAITLIKNSKKE